jgi:hypothetical protein
MASRLDHTIAKVAIANGGWDRPKMIAAAVEAAGSVTPKDLAKLPDRWYPALSARLAGAPDLDDAWQHLWFEALAEILFQKGAEGLPALLILWEREDSTYWNLILIRLLRLAADGVESDLILSRVRFRLESLHYVQTRLSVREVMEWQGDDPRPLELLRPMAGIEVPNSDGDTVRTYIERFEWERGIAAERAGAAASA